MLRIFDKFRERPVSDEEFIQAWLDAPMRSIKGQFGAPVEWRTCYGLAPFEGLPDSHGYSELPDLKVTVKVRKSEAVLGWIEGLSMHSGGTVRVRHFALQESITANGHGSVLLSSIIKLLKEKNATKIEFRETHTTKLEHYRKLFAKNGIKEVTRGVWVVNLYADGEIPDDVLAFQASLLKNLKR